MNDKPTAWEQDAVWLLKRLPEATDEQLDNFCERVSLIWQDCNDTEFSRNLAFKCLGVGYVNLD